MKIFDSHAHYDDEAFHEDQSELLDSLPSAGVVGLINAGVSAASSRKSVELAAKYPFIHAAVGIHPEEAASVADGDLEQIGLLAAGGRKVVAIGEIGLDYHCENPDRAAQIALFEAQLRLAQTLRLPVIVHDRDAHADTLSLLKKYKPHGVMHCFSGSAETASEIIALGMYLGFTGAITFKNNKKAAGVIASVPRDRLLVETDCPYMSPEPLRGRRCDSGMLVHTIGRMAFLIGLTPEETALLTAKNAASLFGIRV